MLKKVAAISLVFIIALSVSACQGEKLPSAQEITNGIIEALNNTETYKLDMDMDIEMTVEAEGETIEMTMGAASSGAIDMENGEMKMDMVIDMVVPDEGEMEMEMVMYVIDDMMYAGMDMPLLTEGPMWVKSEIPEGILEQMNQVESQIELLEYAQVEVIGSEKVKGIDCYVIEVTPDMDQLWELAMQQSDVAGGTLPDIADEAIRNMFDGYSVKFYVAKDTYFLMRSAIDMTIELTPDDLGFPGEEGSMTMNITMDLLAYDYNLPVSIELPPEAEDAEEVPAGSISW